MPTLTAFEPLAPQDPRTIGAFRLRARLGSGGMGRVYLGSSPAGRAVAVKVVHPELARDEMFRKRFRQEVAAARRVSGAYTAPVIDAGPDDEIPWLATAYVAGPSVADAVAAAGPLSPDAVLRLGGGLAEALADIHATDLVHRDLKPSNVLLAADGPRVIDFGISRALETTMMTTTGVVIGTPAFMSPEQAAGHEAGHATDVFSLGAVLVYAATGRVPFGEGSPVTVLYRVVHAEPQLDGLDGPLRDLIVRCLAKDPTARPTAREVAALVYQLSTDNGGHAETDSFWPAILSALISSYADRAAKVPAWLADTRTVPQAADSDEPTGLAPADAVQRAVSDVAATPGDPVDGDVSLAANGADADRESASADSPPLILAGVSSANATAPSAIARDAPGPDVSVGREVPGGPGLPPRDMPGARSSSASGGAARPARSRRPRLSKGAVAAGLVVLLAACVTAAVTLLPSGGSKPGAAPPTHTVSSTPTHTVSSTPTHTVSPSPTHTVSPTPTRTVSSPPHRSYPVPGLLGAPNWNGYCQAQGLGAAHLTQQNAYGWYCTQSSNGIDANAVCAWTFQLSTSQVTNSVTNFNDPNTWKCWSATEELSVPNWNGYCQAQGLGTAHLTQNNAYGWYCTKSGNGLDGNSVCAWTNGASTLVVSRFQNFYDANSWQCWV